MTEALLDRRDLEFQLYEVLDTAGLCERERFHEHDRDTFDAVIESADRIAREKFAPHNALADREEPHFVDGRVEMRPEVKDAIDAYADAGFIAGRYDESLGGMQLPESVMTACNGFFVAANPGTAGYPFLTMAAANVIRLFGSQQQCSTYLPPMLEGRFTGTMALTEPQAGSSLADLTTSATPTEDGHYLIRGAKLYISGGEHELADNIIHLVLARIKGAPASVKGISMFIVPKYRLDGEGNPAERNGISLAGLIHKLGYRSTTSTALSFGDDAPCYGYLVGEPHQGLKYMFQMMNEARLGVGFGAAAIGYRGYLHSLDYARERLQGRPPSNKDPASPPVALIEHADVRRMLLAQKAWVEGALALCLYGARLVDDSQTHPEREERERARQLLDLLTPVIKAWPSEYGTRANDLAIQVHGGAGYTREYPVEQCWRDNRLNPIHEGTNGIQALDLLGRKVWQEKGLELLLGAIQAEMAAAADKQCQQWAQSLGETIERVGEVTRRLGRALGEEGPDDALANASVYLHLFGHVVVAWMWLRQANVAVARLDADIGRADRNFYLGKIQAARYFFHWELPGIGRDLEILDRMDDTCLAMKDEWF
ncbi:MULTISPECIES: acyl-CoA dehydrogenase [unclassified Wenzhouxiangella]|uniref:acyl-CoA dehydrogenase n=1 Tax=unclassified Wenzhouxiangella TaxID=2613841 RepID=UPI000E32A451|nr:MULTISPECIES: acyl-CoA dehydrogenase [unclassified Wenzhouxiangella]RFF27266.1 acyl-CoA dehydrogenase [Wenzhouxiangella sp. 15181]RFP69276.1 acyl-CoA dehydrogenase [Wenzhouxiangella sp. 15190]